ncbi:MAG: hypothetical protein JW725_05000 [Candidatus Babeliaceae bacterium]|nr:hypothetical protein [Candidatus Babeliaceae bacterium]
MAQHHWQGHTVDVQMVLDPKYLWVAGGFVVNIDSSNIFKYHNKFEAGGTSTDFSISERNSAYTGSVRSVGRVLAMRTKYQVIIEGNVIAEGVLRAKNWYILYAMMPILFGVFFVLVRQFLR